MDFFILALKGILGLLAFGSVAFGLSAIIFGVLSRGTNPRFFFLGGLSLFLSALIGIITWLLFVETSGILRTVVGSITGVGCILLVTGWIKGQRSEAYGAITWLIFGSVFVIISGFIVVSTYLF